jgi:hypothetical protein
MEAGAERYVEAHQPSVKSQDDVFLPITCPTMHCLYLNWKDYPYIRFRYIQAACFHRTSGLSRVGRYTIAEATLDMPIDWF